MKNITKLVSIGSFIACTFVGQIANAQFAPNASEPTEITADKAEYEGNRTILTGGVDVRQGETRILADKMIITMPQGGSLTDSDFEKIIAEGHFYYITPEQTVRGEKGVYTKATNSFEVTKNVILKQKDGNIITGDRLIYNLANNHAKVVGNCKGRKCGANGRVRILIKNSKSVALGGTG